MINTDKQESFSFKHSKNFIHKSCLSKTSTTISTEETNKDTINEPDKNMLVN